MADLAPEQLAAEEEVASGVLRLSVGGAVRLVPELKRGPNRAWQGRMRNVFASLAGVPSDTPAGLAAMFDAELELVLAYDATGALGDLEDATERGVDAIYNRLVEVSFPLASSPMAVGMAMLREAAASLLASSPSSPSPSGTSRPTPSTRPSPSGRSSSSTPRRRSG